MKTIDAMNQLVAAWDEMMATHRPSALFEHVTALREAIAREEAQTVEPYAYLCVLPTKDAGPTKFFTAPSDPRGFPVFTHPAPVKQPSSGERDALINELRRDARIYSIFGDDVRKHLSERAANMLAADAQRITELEALSITKIMLDIVPGDGDGHEVYVKSVSDVEDQLTEMGCKIEDFKLAQEIAELESDYTDQVLRAMAAEEALAQQVAVPQGLTKIEVTEAMHRAAVKVLHRAHGLDGLPQRMMDAMLAAAPQPPQTAPRVPMTLAESKKLEDGDDRASFAG